MTRRLTAFIVGVTATVVTLSTAAPPASAAPVTTAAPVTASTTAPAYDEIVVKVDLAGGRTLAEVTGAFPVTLVRALLQSRGLYLLRATRAADRGSMTAIRSLATRVAGSEAVTFAEPNFVATMSENRYHSWPEGSPTPVSKDPARWLQQTLVTTLQLRKAQGLSTGAGVRVAVLDTGVDREHPALAGRLLPGYDYVDDDGDPSDVDTRVDTDGDGLVAEAYGHGTFVAGMVALVAPGARIMPYRVLNSDGVGNVFVVAQALMDAVDDGAQVINISFGTDELAESWTLRDALSYAQRKSVIVVAAAGNDASMLPHYPAAESGVLSVTSMTGSRLSSWANRGFWVKLAAPGDSVVGPVPGGGYAAWSGTSMASPVVTGEAAMVRSRYPSSSRVGQLRAITASARPLIGVTSGSVDLVASLSYWWLP